MKTGIVQLGIVLIPIGIFFWIVWQNLVPTGMFVVRHSVQNKSAFIDRIMPNDRASYPHQDAQGDWIQEISGDPTYFFVHPHRSFKQVQAEVWLKNQQVPILELGALANTLGPSYDLHPLQNLLIDRSSWQKIEQNGVMLLQRTPVFSSLEDFLTHLPDRKEIATYHYKFSEPYRIASYEPSFQEQTFTVSLKGSHEFYTYIKNEPLQFAFIFENLEDDQTIQAQIVLTDEQDQTLFQKNTDNGKAEIFLPNLPEGVYKIQIKAKESTVLRQIKTTQQKMTFLNHLFFAESEEGKSFWTEAKTLSVATDRAQATQHIVWGKEFLDVSEPFISFQAQIQESGLTQIQTQKGNIRLDTTGLFSFSKESWFNPYPVRLWPSSNLDLLGINYIIAEYTSPQQQGDWVVARVNFDTSIFDSQDPKTWKFVFSAAEIKESQFFSVGKINLFFSRDPLTLKGIIDEIRKLLRRSTLNG